jgi:hypothetical protein
MAFKLVSKNNIGIFTTFILVILLSQSNFFDFLMDTPLGRITLLAFVIFIAYANQMLGLIAVLCIIIAFNNNVNIVSGYNLYEGFTNKPDDGMEPEKKKSKSKQSTAQEGFCMTDRESNMLRGKQSNTISVSNNLREQTDDVSPSDKSIFTSDYETF